MSQLGYGNALWDVVDDADDECYNESRILSDQEIRDRLYLRKDIFTSEKTKFLWSTECIALCMAAIAGFWAHNQEIVKIVINDSEYDRIPRDKGSIINLIEIDRNEPKNVMPSLNNHMSTKKLIHPNKIANHSSRINSENGVGSIRSKIARMQIFETTSQAINGKNLMGGDIFGKNGVTSGIDQVIAGSSGLKQGASRLSRKGFEGIGGSLGIGTSGFGGNGGDGNNLDDIYITDRTDLQIKIPTKPFSPIHDVTLHEGIRISGRSKSEIFYTVNQNVTALRYLYNQRLREKPGLKGKITVRFTIDEFGKVVNCVIDNSSLQDQLLELLIVQKIKAWRFNKVDKPGDMTEVVYPFVFSS